MTERERRWRQTNTLTWWYGQHERLKDIGSRFCFFPSSMALTNPLKSHKCVLREEKRCTGQTDSVLSFSYNKERERQKKMERNLLTVKLAVTLYLQFTLLYWHASPPGFLHNLSLCFPLTVFFFFFCGLFLPPRISFFSFLFKSEKQMRSLLSHYSTLSDICIRFT